MSTDPAIEASIDAAADAVGSAWPIHSFVTANPLSGYEDRPFHEAVADAERLLGGDGYPSADVFRRAWEDGRIDDDVLVIVAPLAREGVLRDVNSELARSRIDDGLALNCHARVGVGQHGVPAPLIRTLGEEPLDLVFGDVFRPGFDGDGKGKLPRVGGYPVVDTRNLDRGGLERRHVSGDGGRPMRSEPPAAVQTGRTVPIEGGDDPADATAEVNADAAEPDGTDADEPDAAGPDGGFVWGPRLSDAEDKS